MKRAFSLIELLISVAILSVIIGLLLPAVSKGFKRGKARALKVYHWHDQRLTAFWPTTENNEASLMYHATNTADTYGPEAYLLPKELQR